MTAKQHTRLSPKQREALFVKLRAATPYPLADIAPLLGLSIPEAFVLETRLREEINLERSILELKNALKNG